MERRLRRPLIFISLGHFLISATLIGFWISADELEETGSTFNIKQLSKPQPLLLKSKNLTGNDRYFCPNNREGETILKENDVVTFICLGNSLVIDSTDTKVESSESVHSWGKFTIFDRNVVLVSIKYTTVNIDQLGNPQPLILKSNTFKGNDRYYWPSNRDGDIIFKEGDIITLACPGNALIVGSTNTSVESSEAVHNSGTFTILDQSVTFSDIKCKSQPTNTARYTEKSCLGSYQEAEIGFQLKNEFIRHIKLCFDNKSLKTLYSEFTMTRFIDGFQTYPSTEFKKGDFFNIDSVKTVYTRKTQRQTINELVGLSTDSEKYVSLNDDRFLSKGHLAAKVDFVYEPQQRFTFHYINVAPQWQTFNGGNWKTLEEDVRTFVAKQNTDVIVFTGTHGVAVLQHELDKKFVELFLYNKNGRQALPVPQLFWKVLYKPNQKAGIAFVGVNNPYRFNANKDVICKDICDQVSWLNWSASNTTYGYSYCCDVNDLRQTVKTLPEFTVSNLLH